MDPQCMFRRQRHPLSLPKSHTAPSTACWNIPESGFTFTSPPPFAVSARFPLSICLGRPAVGEPSTPFVVRLLFGQHPALNDGDPRQQLIEFVVVSDGQIDVTRDDA